VYELNITESLTCPICNGVHFEVKREATYLYTYKLNTPNTEHWSENEETLPFLFDNREQIGNKEYLECKKCGSQFPCSLDELKERIEFTILRKAVRSDTQTNPEFLG
jgi:transcription elongation factor Elf1